MKFVYSSHICAQDSNKKKLFNCSVFVVEMYCVRSLSTTLVHVDLQIFGIVVAQICLLVALFSCTLDQ